MARLLHTARYPGEDMIAQFVALVLIFRWVLPSLKRGAMQVFFQRHAGHALREQLRAR